MTTTERISSTRHHHTRQYPTSSYLHEQKRMTPYAIGYPESTADVEAFATFAIKEGKKVVVRSGGHQYCGLSSGGSGTLLLRMDELNNIYIKKLDTGEVRAHVGPGAHLTRLAKTFNNNGVTIPHGECPQVCIGGHVQTGGFVHTLRSYGLALDHVKSFNIVLANPVSPSVESRIIQRPINAVNEESSPDDRIFWGVTGGGPGSFGVITSIEFECVQDTDHPYSCGYQGAYLYCRKVFEAAVVVVQKRTEDVFNPDLLPNDCDLMVTVLSDSFDDPIHPAVVLVEMVHGNCSGLPLSDDNTGQARMEKEIGEIGDINKSKPWWMLGPFAAFNPKQHKSLSSMSNAFVRIKGMTTHGREFRFPDVKRLNCTTKVLSADFIEKFVRLVDKAMWTPHVKFVFQMVMGGGAYKRNGLKGIASLPHRNNVIGIVFDIFYKPGGEGGATKLQEEFGNLVNSSWGEDVRITWGSFGDIDMSNVHEEVYGSSNDLYESLQKLKQDVDPLDSLQRPAAISPSRWCWGWWWEC